MLLAVRADQPQAVIYLLENGEEVARREWEAHRQLSDTLLLFIEEMLEQHNADWASLNGVIVFKGPGSFTGLRISITVANTLAQSLTIPVVGTQGETWLERGIAQIEAGADESIVSPEYGGEANITKPKK